MMLSSNDKWLTFKVHYLNGLLPIVDTRFISLIVLNK